MYLVIERYLYVFPEPRKPDGLGELIADMILLIPYQTIVSQTSKIT